MLRRVVCLRCAVGVAVLSIFLAITIRLNAQTPAGDVDWRSYGRDLASTKYSPLAQIDRGNFRTLTIAWRWKSADAFLSKRTASGGEWWARSEQILDELLKEDGTRWRYHLGAPAVPQGANMKVTPLMAGGVLYLNTALSMGVALDARTGETLWVHNPKSYEAGTSAMNMQFNARGVAYWSDGKDERIFWGTSDARLMCADAK